MLRWDRLRLHGLLFELIKRPSGPLIGLLFTLARLFNTMDGTLSTVRIRSIIP